MILEKAKWLDLNLDSDCEHINHTINTIATEIGLNRTKQKSALKLILLNLRYQFGTRLITPRGKNSFGPCRYNPHYLGYRSLRRVLDALVKYNYIEQDLGMMNLKKGEGKMTTILSTEDLDMKFFHDDWQFYNIKRAEDAEVIILKKYKSANSKDKVLVDYTDGARSNQMRQDMHNYIDLISGSQILAEELSGGDCWEYDGEPITRSFIDMGVHDEGEVELFAFGGRIYGPWCSFAKYKRNTIQINGEETIELDFPASHVNTMYREMTGNIYPNGDPYVLSVGDTIIPRHIVKRLSSILINVDDYLPAISALKNEYWKLSSSDKKDDVREAEEFYLIVEMVSIRGIADAYLDKHQTIDFYFLKGKEMGNHIQFWESCIVMNVINKLTARGIPVLTIFDSFIVAKQHEPLLKKLMFSVSTSISIAA